jgi:hypothetical protein
MTETQTNNLRKNLDNFIGTERYYRHFLGMLLTDGVHYLCENGVAWLIDAVASYQREPEVTGNKRLQEFQLWELVKTGTSAVLTLREDSGEKPIVTQEFYYTDCPLDKITLYVESGGQGSKVCLLPSEH